MNIPHLGRLIYMKGQVTFTMLEKKKKKPMNSKIQPQILFLAGLGCVGLCLTRLRSYSPAGGRVVARGVRWLGRWFPCVLCGVFGGNVMLDALKTCRDLLRIFSIIFFLLFTLEQPVG
jgi:hypothetical protein